MKTERQIANASNRASKLAWEAVKADQIDNFAATPKQMSDERGGAMCAAQCAAQALGKLENGDLDGFLTSLRLAGQFAQDATVLHYNRTHA